MAKARSRLFPPKARITGIDKVATLLPRFSPLIGRSPVSGELLHYARSKHLATRRTYPHKGSGASSNQGMTAIQQDGRQRLEAVLQEGHLQALGGETYCSR